MLQVVQVARKDWLVGKALLLTHGHVSLLVDRDVGELHGKCAVWTARGELALSGRSADGLARAAVPAADAAHAGQAALGYDVLLVALSIGTDRGIQLSIF